MHEGTSRGLKSPKTAVFSVASPFVLVWDAGWAACLFSVAAVLETLRKYSEGISYGILLFLVSGTAMFNRQFSRLGFGPLYVTEACMVVVAIALAILLHQKRVTLIPDQRASRIIITLVVVFVAIGSVRVLADITTGLTSPLLETLRNFAVIYYAAFAVIGWLILQGGETTSRIRTILTIVVVLSTIGGLKTVLYAAVGLPPSETGSPDEIDASKIISGHAVVFAMFSWLVVVQTWRFGMMARNSILRALATVSLLLNTLFIYLSGHRSALLALGVGAASMFVGHRFKADRRRWPWIILAVALAIFGWHYLSNYLFDFTAKYQTLLDPMAEANAAWRAAMWLAVLALWTTAPLFGVGFSHDFRNEEPWHIMDVDHLDPHNSYLGVLARTGLAGFLALLIACVVFVWAMIHVVRYPKSRDHAFVASCLLACFVAIATFASANVTLETPYHAMFFWLIIGMGIALAENNTPRQDRRAFDLTGLSSSSYFTPRES